MTSKFLKSNFYKGCEITDSLPPDISKITNKNIMPVRNQRPLAFQRSNHRQKCIVPAKNITAMCHFKPWQSFLPVKIENTQFSPQSVKQKVRIHPFSQAKWTATLTHFCHYLNCFENSFYLFSTSKKIKFPFNEKSFHFFCRKRERKS